MPISRPSATVSVVFLGYRDAAQVIPNDTLSYLNMDTLQLNAAWWNVAAQRVIVPAGYNAVEVLFTGVWGASTAGTIRRLTVQSTPILPENADNRTPSANAVYLPSNAAHGIIYNPTKVSLSLAFGMYQDSLVNLNFFSAVCMVRAWQQ